MAFDPDNLLSVVPQQMREAPLWLCYKLVDVGKDRLAKRPVSPRTGQFCSKTAEHEYTDLRSALVAAERFDLDGVGFVFLEPFLAIDLDDCFDENGAMTPIAAEVYERFYGAYWEYSPSGRGLHAFLLAKKPYDRTKSSEHGVEVYGGTSGFVTVTGDVVGDPPAMLPDMQEQIDWLFTTYLPPSVATDAPPVDHGDMTPEQWLQLGLARDKRLIELYNKTEHVGDESGIDFALLLRLAYWLNRDLEAMQNAFLASPWAQSKDAAHKKKLERQDYLPKSAAKAAALCTKTAYEMRRWYDARAERYFTLVGTDDGVELPIDDFTDLANARAMQTIYQDSLCYTGEWGWCYYDGAKWETDAEYRAYEAASSVASSLAAAVAKYAAFVEERGDIDKATKQYLVTVRKHAAYTQSERGLGAMVRLNKQYMRVSADLFDAQPWLLNTPDGVVDLQKGEMLPHDSAYRLTKMTHIAPENKVAPMWDEFLQAIFLGDQALIDYVQLVLGSALFGQVFAENLIVMTGSGRNGKSTLLNTIQEILGDYAVSITPEMLLSKDSGEQARAMAMLEGRRLAVAQETEEGHRLRTSALKRVVSTDPIVARRLYKDPHIFIPTHTLVLVTNHLPKVASIDEGTWRRIVVVPFQAQIPQDRIIPAYHSLLVEREGSGILMWLVDGARKFWEQGCDLSKRPPAVVAASQEYQHEEDWLHAFLDEMFPDRDQANANVFVKHNDLYWLYQRWATERGDYVQTSIAVSRALKNDGWRSQEKWYDAKTRRTYKIWYGLPPREGVVL